uniref:Uncharacterized protein n=1 Tax=Astyanax mexicanus TaxID=7994 RepID=A0A3B1JMR3_ASTMX
WREKPWHEELRDACTSSAMIQESKHFLVEMKPNLPRQANIQIQEIQRTPQRYSSRRATPRHIIHADLLAETLQARREWGPIFNILFFFSHIISYPAKLSFISEGEIKSFTDKQMLRDFVTTRPALKELLKEALNMERNNRYQPLQKHAKL